MIEAEGTRAGGGASLDGEEGGGQAIVGAALVDDERALRDQLQDLNRELAVLSRENARQARELERALRELRDAHWHIKKIDEVLPMCVTCRRVRSSAEVWEDAASYLVHSTDFLSHGYCASCAARVAADLDEQDRQPQKKER